jgi:hypothetical protein
MFYTMKRTQIQLPDWLFDAARNVAETKEISLAEVVRRGLEYMVAVTPEAKRGGRRWKPPRPHALESGDPFLAPDWRDRLHLERLRVAEGREAYDAGEES